MNDFLLHVGAIIVLIVVFVAPVVRFISELKPLEHVECPWCHTIGKVYVDTMYRKRGISGGKATAGILTGGASLLVTGLSASESYRRAHCKHCRMKWEV